MRAWWIAGVLALGPACVASESIGKDVADGGEAGSSGTGESGGTGTGSGSATGVDMPPDPCAAVDGDSSCVACQKQNCCPAWEDCHADDRCVCIMVCTSQGHSLDACLSTCGMDDGQHVDLISCTDGHCAAECP